MKKTIMIAVLVLAFTITTQAQRTNKRMNVEKFSTEQQTTLALKKMTLALDLTESQQRSIKPLIATKIADRKMHLEKMNTDKGRRKLSADERYAKENERLDKEIAMQKQMKRILDEQQYEAFKRMKKRRKGMKKAKKKKFKKRD